MTRQSFSGVRASSRAAIAAALFAGAVGLSLAPDLALAGNPPAPPAVEEQPPAGTTVDGVTATVTADKPASPKYTSAPLDTPQTITVVPAAVAEAQNLLSLRDILTTIPGITFGAGEGGGGYGDSINLRGYSANSDITVDGVRDSAQYSRSDSFNLEQLEVTNGANGAISGAGSVGGNINIVSKAPRGTNFTTAGAGLGTDGYYRGTLDLNRSLGEGVALRLNVMVHENDVAGRDVEHFSRFGIAPSVIFGLNGQTQFTLSGFYQSDDNIPQYGVPWVSNSFFVGPVPGTTRSAYYGFRNVDKQQSEVASLTARIDHRFSDRMSIRNLTRYQVVDQTTVAAVPQTAGGNFCMPDGFLVTNPATACGTPGVWVRNTGGTTRITGNTVLHNQTDLTLKFNTSGVEHNAVVGLSFTSETFHLANGASLRGADGSSPTTPQLTASLTTPDSLYTGPINFIQSGAQFGDRRNQSLYVFDTAKFSDQFQVNFGLRLEHNQGTNRTDTHNTTVGSPTLGQFVSSTAPGTNDETLFSYRVGLVWKPRTNASLYLAYGDSKTPSQSALNGGCTPAGGVGVPGTCNTDAESATNIELGGKWDVLEGARLSLTAAVFRNERSPFRVASNDPLLPGAQVLDGKSRVDGFTFGAVGRIDEKWSIFANYTWLDSVIVQGKSDFCVANPLGAGCPTAAADTTGRPLTGVPNHAASLWTTWDVTDRLQLGYGITYSGEYTVVNSGLPVITAPGHTVHRAMATWRINRQAEIRININNLTDEVYYTRLRNNAVGWATPGDARNATVTLNYRF